MDIQFLIPAVLFLLCLALRTAYELLKDRGKINLESKPIFAGIFSVMCVLWVSWFSLCPADPFPIELPNWVRWTGLTVFVAGMILAFGAFVQLRGVENIDHLVTRGLFKHIRHPMYLGFISWIIGWSVYHSAAVSLAIGTAGIVSAIWWRHLEEKRLEVEFGEDYRQYQLTTWF